MTTPEQALAEVRHAYRLVWEYQRTILDLAGHIMARIDDVHPDLRFRSWGPDGYPPPAGPTTDPTASGRWAWELLPLYRATFRWATAPQPAERSVQVRFVHIADDAFAVINDGEPSPGAFGPPEEATTWLGVYVIAPRRVDPRRSWDDLFALAGGPAAAAWRDGEVHTFDADGSAFRYGGVRVDAARIATSVQTERELIAPLLAVLRKVARV